MAYFSVLLILSALMVTSCALVHQSRHSKNVWERRVNATLDIVRSRKHCPFSGYNCVAASRVPVWKMNLYTAEATTREQKLKVVLPDKFRVQKSRRRNKYEFPDIVIAIDPFPKASFGHTVLVFYVYEHKSKADCENERLKGTFTAFSECIAPARKRNCGNTLERKRRRCEIDFVPLVYSENDAKKRTQKLKCRDDLLGFGTCRTVNFAKPVPCQNTPRCGNPPSIDKKFCFYDHCDYAVLIGGAWTPQTAHPRYKKNLQLFWNFLHKENNFSAEHITTFYGHDGAIELDGNFTTRDAFPAVNEISVRARVKEVCGMRSCVDTLVLYLTGPARINGALLFWDENNDGLIEDKEEYSFYDLMTDLKNCDANNVLLVADYSYSGQLVHKFPGKRPSQKVVVISSTSQHEYTWRNDFTKTFIESSRGGRSRSMREIFEETKRRLSQRQYESHPQMTNENRKVANLTIYGGPSNADVEKKGCQLLSRNQWPGYRKPKNKRSSSKK